MYRNADYDKDDDHKSTASFPEGLREEYRYLPNLFHVMRRTSSMDNLTKFERYFGLVQKNCGRSFQWRHYARILHDGLRHFRTPKLPKRVRSTPRSDVSVYFTASEAAVVTPGVKITSKKGFRRMVSGYISGEGSPCTSSASVKSQLKKVSFHSE
ncbi:uncharacterized protein TNIN_387401 [Trichonephila inaurata madagascariensis]|uniref:Uncharacterized protein n=1 Tax=Trichonephila inaurata madagascariensis TaxID=2747483 RepID=A0A8X7CGD7_9ARAC|nr:uncharacterized protein TNIN_387401 [Trichonephila inaurata madagascariensis]